MKFYDEKDGETWKDLYEDFQLANNTILLSEEHSVVRANCTSDHELTLEVMETTPVMDWQEGALILGNDQKWCFEAANESKPFFRHVEGSPELRNESPSGNPLISIPTSKAEFNEAFEFAHVKYITRAQKDPKEKADQHSSSTGTSKTRMRSLNQDNGLLYLDFNYNREADRAEDQTKKFFESDALSDVFQATCSNCYGFLDADFEPAFTVDLDRNGEVDPRYWDLEFKEIKAIFKTSMDIHGKIEIEVLGNGGHDESTIELGSFSTPTVDVDAILPGGVDVVPSITVTCSLKAKLTVDADQSGRLAIGLGYHKDEMELGWEYAGGDFKTVHKQSGNSQNFYDPTLELDLPSRISVTAELFLEMELHINGGPFGLKDGPATLSPSLVYELEVDYKHSDCPPHEPMHYYSNFKLELSAYFPDISIGGNEFELCGYEYLGWARGAISQFLNLFNPFLDFFDGIDLFHWRVPFINSRGCIEVTLLEITLHGVNFERQPILELSPYRGCGYFPVPNPATPNRDDYVDDSLAINYAGNGQARLVIPIPLGSSSIAAYCSNCYAILPSDLDLELKISVGNPFAEFLPFVGKEQGTRRGAQLQKLKAVLSGKLEINLEFTFDVKSEVSIFHEWLLSEYFASGGYKRLTTITIPLGPVPIPVGVFFALPAWFEFSVKGAGVLVIGMNYSYEDVKLGFDYDTSRSGTRDQLIESYSPDLDKGSGGTIGPDISIAAGATFSFNVGPSITLAFLELLPFRIDFPVVGFEIGAPSIGEDTPGNCGGDEVYITVDPFLELRLAFVNPLLLYADADQLAKRLGAGEQTQEKVEEAEETFEIAYENLGVPDFLAKALLPSFLYKPVKLASLRAYISPLSLAGCVGIPNGIPNGAPPEGIADQTGLSFPPSFSTNAPWPPAPPAPVELPPEKQCTDAMAPDDDSVPYSIPCQDQGSDCSDQNVVTIFVKVLRGTVESAPGHKVTLKFVSPPYDDEGSKGEFDGLTSVTGCVMFKVATGGSDCSMFSVRTDSPSRQSSLGCHTSGELFTIINLDREPLEGTAPITMACSECWCIKPVHDTSTDILTGGLAFHFTSRTLLFTGCTGTDCSSGTSQHFLSRLDPYTNEANQIITVDSVEPASIECYSWDSVAAAGQHDVAVFRLASGKQVKMVDIATSKEVKSHTAAEDYLFLSAALTPTGDVFLIEKNPSGSKTRVLNTSLSEGKIERLDTLSAGIDVLEWDQFRGRLYVYETSASKIRTYKPGSGYLDQTIATGYIVTSMSLSSDGELLFFVGKRQNENLSSYRIYMANLTTYDIDVLAGDNPSATPVQAGSPASKASISAPFVVAASDDPKLLFYADVDQGTIMAMRDTCANAAPSPQPSPSPSPSPSPPPPSPSPSPQPPPPSPSPSPSPPPPSPSPSPQPPPPSPSPSPQPPPPSPSPSPQPSPPPSTLPNLPPLPDLPDLPNLPALPTLPPLPTLPSLPPFPDLPPLPSRKLLASNTAPPSMEDPSHSPDPSQIDGGGDPFLSPLHEGASIVPVAAFMVALLAFALMVVSGIIL